MKTLERLAVGQLNGLERLSMEELSNFVGGSGCFWNCLGYVYTFCDKYDDNDGNKDSAMAAGAAYRDIWGSRGGYLNEDGDPSPKQKDKLFKFINCTGVFTTTGSSWQTSGFDNITNGSDLGMALVMIGDDENQHAHIIQGRVQYEQTSNNNSRGFYYDKSQNNTKVYVDEIKYGTGLKKK